MPSLFWAPSPAPATTSNFIHGPAAVHKYGSTCKANASLAGELPHVARRSVFGRVRRDRRVSCGDWTPWIDTTHLGSRRPAMLDLLANFSDDTDTLDHFRPLHHVASIVGRTACARPGAQVCRPGRRLIQCQVLNSSGRRFARSSRAWVGAAQGLPTCAIMSLGTHVTVRRRQRPADQAVTRSAKSSVNADRDRRRATSARASPRSPDPLGRRGSHRWRGGKRKDALAGFSQPRALLGDFWHQADITAARRGHHRRAGRRRRSGRSVRTTSSCP